MILSRWVSGFIYYLTTDLTTDVKSERKNAASMIALSRVAKRPTLPRQTIVIIIIINWQLIRMRIVALSFL